MKEMLQSKVLIGFVFFVLGFTYFNTYSMEPTNISLEEEGNKKAEIVLK